MLAHLIATWSILRPFGVHILWPFSIFHGYLVYFSRFGMLYQEKSGNPALHSRWGKLTIQT
jgi:hypothetical protein